MSQKGRLYAKHMKACICFLLQYAGLSHRGHSSEEEGEEEVQSL